MSTSVSAVGPLPASASTSRTLQVWRASALCLARRASWRCGAGASTAPECAAQDPCGAPLFLCPCSKMPRVHRHTGTHGHTRLCALRCCSPRARVLTRVQCHTPKFSRGRLTLPDSPAAPSHKDLGSPVGMVPTAQITFHRWALWPHLPLPKPSCFLAHLCPMWQPGARSIPSEQVLRVLAARGALPLGGRRGCLSRLGTSRGLFRSEAVHCGTVNHLS